MDLKKIMKVWMTSFLVLFGMVELYQWFRDFTLPLPVFILAGALLAIASNYGKSPGLSYEEPATELELNRVKKSKVRNFTSSSNFNLPSNQSMSTSASINQRSISFTISCPEREITDRS